MLQHRCSKEESKPMLQHRCSKENQTYAATLLQQRKVNLYNPQNDFFSLPKTKRPKFQAEKQNEMVSKTTNTQTKSKH
ncbi:MAG: hypothetical protein II826_09380 [Prevotella sp.]|nr:hypothetical protein [Prevotella sp.]